MTEDRFAVQLPGLDLKNPFMPSSGSFYYGLDHMKDFDLNKMGALVLKTTTVALMLDLRTDFSLPCKLIAEEHFLYDSIFTRI
ncbi:hypothetical protein [Weissella confusa]|uniref:hypothetical protein n=1 Tax=Weissella confusa TaxID=1583 RepID=UPI001F5521EE|nr:hypothetical protein [Weissella confusa]